MNKLKQNSAITLIALVITIIVLLILAGLTLTFVLGENGLFTKARKAKEETEKAQAVEDIKLKILEVQTEAASEGRIATLENLYNKLKNIVGQEYKVTKEAQTASLAAGSLTSWETITKLYIRNMKYSYVVEVGSNLQVENDVQTSSESISTPGGNSGGAQTVEGSLGMSTLISNIDFSITNITNSSITINIVATTNNESNIIGYHVFCIKDSDNSVKKTKVDENNVITITDLEKITKYNIYVVVYDKNNNERTSNIQSATTKNELVKNSSITESTKDKVLVSKEQGNNTGWKAFDGTPSTSWENYWCDDDNAPAYIGLDFEIPVCIQSIKFKNYSSGVDGLYTGKVQYSYDGTSWNDSTNGIYTGERTTEWQTINVTDGVNARYWRLYIITNGGVQWTALQEVEMYYY